MESEETAEAPQTTPTQKVYCCSNYPQTEAGLIGKFDLVWAVAAFLMAITAIVIISASGNTDLITQNAQNDLQKNQSLANDVNYFLYWSSEKQIVTLSLQSVVNVVRIGFTIVLLLGVKKKNHAYLLTWFIFKLVMLGMEVVSSIIAIVFANDLILLIVLSVLSFLYGWYCLWIVKLLMSEIRAVREGYANPLDDGEIDHANNLMPSSDSFNVDKF